VLQCEACARVYRFDMLDWDDDHEVRVFRLAALPPQSLDECVAIFSPTDAPRWPVWVPERSKLPSEEARESADRAVEGILHQAESAELLVAWAGYGQVTLVAKQVPVETLRELPDWFSVENLAEIQKWLHDLTAELSAKEKARAEAVRRFLAHAQASTFRSEGPYPSRDELHERR